ncbi:MAG: dihydrodipicolinate synthase family protein, partial [Candidatus Hodarchaeota archaeon]
GANVLFLCGSTGEGQYIQKHVPEHRATILKAAKEAIDDLNTKIPVIIGIFGNKPAEVERNIEMISKLQEDNLGYDIIDGYVISPPLEKKLEDDELRTYLEEIIQPLDKAVFLYNNPSTFGDNNISISIYNYLMNKFDTIKGFKDSSPSLKYKTEIMKIIEDKESISFYTGKEGDFFKCLKVRTPRNSKQIGCIPSIGNVLNIPSRIITEYNGGNVEKASQLQDTLNSIRNNIYHEPKTKGKAQRGAKYALSCIYKNTNLDREVTVIPDFKREMTGPDKEKIQEAIELATKMKYFDKIDEF